MSKGFLGEGKGAGVGVVRSWWKEDTATYNSFEEPVGVGFG